MQTSHMHPHTHTTLKKQVICPFTFTSEFSKENPADIHKLSDFLQNTPDIISPSASYLACTCRADKLAWPLVWLGLIWFI